ncbi:protein Osi24 isoform X2 [Megachile rotundata]|uniref:protein Osi24 isoform X2 n=1 Tax=Megachile rotundata TaxID=143995 RepID=UPI003FD391D5
MIDSFVQPKYVRLSKLTFNAGRFSKTTSRPPNDRGSRCSYRSSLKVASRERERESSATETQRTMLSRGLLALMAIAWLQPSFGDHVSNDTGHEQENEVFSYDLEPHPHESPDKPSKLDTNLNQMIQTDDKLQYQIEASQLENATSSPEDCQSCVQQELSDLLDRLSGIEDYNVTDSVQIVRNRDVARTDEKAIFQGKSTFLTGFGLGFLAFGLKKLLLPLIFGVQIIKSVLIALFLPSIIGSIGNIVGKGVTSFAQSAHTTAQPEENFEFKDNSDLYNDDYLTRQPVGTLPASAMYDESMMQPQKSPEIASRYSFVDPRITHANAISDRYYTRHVAAHGLSKKQDFKVFHEIPTSSLLLTNYDPFYSPLLSRLDAVFSRLGHTTEGCREYAVCAMYRSPARFAPYSNLVSAQLSRELNELRRPSSDNPDVLRFFRYMKAAKDGQDGVKCEDAYSKCAIAQEDQTLRQNQAMLATYQDIDKLVHARKL